MVRDPLSLCAVWVLLQPRNTSDRLWPIQALGVIMQLTSSQQCWLASKACMMNSFVFTIVTHTLLCCMRCNLLLREVCTIFLMTLLRCHGSTWILSGCAGAWP